MTDRPELDDWLDRADQMLDEDCYGRSWEAEAMHVKGGEAYDQDDPDGDPEAMLDAWMRRERSPSPIPYRLSEQAAIDAYAGTPVAGRFDPRIAEIVAHESGWDRAEAARQLAVYGEVYTWGGRVITREEAQAHAERFVELRDYMIQVGRSVGRTWQAVLLALGPVFDRFTEAARQATTSQETVNRVRARPARQPRETCARHGQPLRAGQCRLCQRAQLRR